MAQEQSDNAWGDFWALNARGNTRGKTTGCLPQRWAAIEDAQRSAWTAFIDRLPTDARVLDLATGDGRVLGWMRAKRMDLDLTGIDLAPNLPPPPEDTKTLCGVSMEALPFEEGSFNSVVSQFGFEYGEVPKVTAEIGRVLTKGGQVGLLVHRADGPILEHNLQRQRELLWALRDKALGQKVRQLLKQGSAKLDKATAVAARVAEQGAEKFGQQSPAWEIPEAIRRTCIMGRRDGVGSIIETIGTIETHAKNELGRIQSLNAACHRADDRGKIITAFEGVGLTLQDTHALHEPSGRELADFITFA